MYTVYLAGPIDYRGDSEFQRKTKLKQHAVATGVVAVYDPETAWSTTAAPFASVQETNMKILNDCDGLLAVLPRGILTVGTVLEIYNAATRGIPTVVVGEMGWALKWLGVRVIDPTATLNPVEELLTMVESRNVDI